MKTMIIVIVSLIAVLGAQAQDQLTAVTGGTLVRTDGRGPLEDSVILIRDGRIVRVGQSQQVRIPKGAEVVDARGKWIIPGLIDAHIHFHQSGGLYTRPDVIDLRRIVPYGEEVKKIRSNIRDTFARYLACGITSVIDVGGPFWNFEVRDLSRKTEAAPRVEITGPLLSTYEPPVLSRGPDPQIVKISSPKEGRRLVRRQAARNPDFIKIWFIVRRGETPETFLPVVRAVIDESHRHHLRVIVHATELETARAAVRAGADILAHSVEDREVDGNFIRLLKKRNVPLVTTLAVTGGYRRTFSQQQDFSPAEMRWANPYIMSTLFDLRHIPSDEIPRRVRDLLRNPKPVPPPTVQMKNLKKLQEAGVTIAVGTDAGNIGTLPGPSIFRELNLMVEAGLSPAQVLAAATIGGAKVMGREKELGRLEEGMLADMVILNSDPLADIRNTSDINLVIKKGKPLRPEEIVRKGSEEIVQQQVNAYNARNLDAFLETYAPDAAIYAFPDTLLSSGREALRKEYRQLFESGPALHRRTVDRLVSGNFVIDRVETGGLPGKNATDSITIYEVVNGVIQRVWLMPDVEKI
jgi:imidazolonepropionase-like amidohydrolase